MVALRPKPEVRASVCSFSADPAHPGPCWAVLGHILLAGILPALDFQPPSFMHIFAEHSMWQALQRPRWTVPALGAGPAFCAGLVIFTCPGVWQHVISTYYSPGPVLRALSALSHESSHRLSQALSQSPLYMCGHRRREDCHQPEVPGLR